MFGIGKLIGGALEAVGLGKIAPFVSLAVNAFTGNWPAVAMDVAGLASRIAPNSKFAKALSTVAPIASSFMGGGGFAGGVSNLLKGGRIGELANGFKSLTSGFEAIKSGEDLFGGATKIFDAFKTAQSFINDQNLFETRSADAHRELGFGNVFQPAE